jgi:hypothetical protein
MGVTFGTNGISLTYITINTSTPSLLTIVLTGGCKMRSVASLFALILLVAVCVSCDFSEVPIIQPQAAESGSVLYSDDFSNPNSGWDTWTQNGSAVVYQDGTLRIFVNEPQYSFWSRPGKRYDDARIQVDAVRMGGPVDNDMGVICRYKNEDNFYAFLISSDQYGGIMKVKDGEYHLLTGEMLAYIEAIKSGDESNNIAADCVGSTLTLTVNGEQVASVTDSDFTTGEVGVIAGTYDLPGVDIAFDNFVVMKP